MVVVQEASFTRLMIFSLKGSVHPNYTKINKSTLHCPSVESCLLNRSIFTQDVLNADFRKTSCVCFVFFLLNITRKHKSQIVCTSRTSTDDTVNVFFCFYCNIRCWQKKLKQRKTFDLSCYRKKIIHAAVTFSLKHAQQNNYKCKS